MLKTYAIHYTNFKGQSFIIDGLTFKATSSLNALFNACKNPSIKTPDMAYIEAVYMPTITNVDNTWMTEQEYDHLTSKLLKNKV
jgi:hypothetical protein